MINMTKMTGNYHLHLPGNTSGYVMLMDGVVYRDCTHSSVSARVYSLGKNMVWRTFYHISAQASKIAMYGTRGILTDTDSVLYACERRLSSWEQWLHKLLYNDPSKPTLYRDSEISKEISSQNFRMWCSLLDFSSISSESNLYTQHLGSSPGVRAMVKYLALRTKKQLMTWKSECEFLDLAHVVCPSPKTYNCEVLSPDVSLPLSCAQSSNLPFPTYGPTDPLNLIRSKPYTKKAKGIRKSILTSQTSLLEFVDSVRTNEHPRRVTEFSLRKSHFRIFLIERKKALISRNIVKRLSYEKLRKRWSFFTLPLHAKQFSM